MLTSHDFQNMSEIVLAVLETHRSLQLKVKVIQVAPFLSTVATGMLHYQISAVYGPVTECHLSIYF